MADGFETYHVPQQSRRDKLRILPQTTMQSQHDHTFQTPPPPPPQLYDPSSLLFHSDFIASCPKVINLVKEEGLNFMGSYLPLNPNSNSTNDTDNTTPPTTYPFVYAPNNLQVLRDFDDHVVFRPEPLCLELNLQRYGGGSGSNVLYNDQNMVSSTTNFGGSSSISGSDFISKELSRSNYAVPLGPFTGYATILKRSRFLKPAQQLLEEFCYVGIRSIDNDDNDGTVSFIESPTDHNIVDDSNHDIGGESGRKKSRLNSMLDEVCRKYRQYYQQIQEVIASFECVAGLGNAAPYATLALKTLSKHFRSLKNAITEHLQFTIKAHRQMEHGKDTFLRSGNTDHRGIFSQRAVHNPGYIEHQPVWRPQRGLPERAVTVLRAWLFEHFLHPYPTDTDKLMLAKQTGLSRSQVSNWFINARVRLWKPMVEEIHMLETRQAQKTSQERNSESRPSHQEPVSSSVGASNPSPSTQRAGQDVLSKRIRNELTGLPLGIEAPPNMSYDSLSSNPHLGAGVSAAGRSSSVSLTLGLHQNNGVGLSERFNQAQQFGLNPGANAEGYAMNGFEAQHRPFGRDVIGGQLLHDSVG